MDEERREIERNIYVCRVITIEWEFNLDKELN